MLTKRINYERKSLQKEMIFSFVILFIVLIIFGYELRLLESEYTIQSITSKEIDYDKYRSYYLEENTLSKAQQLSSLIKKRYSFLKNNTYVNEFGYLTFSMMANTYDLKDNQLTDPYTFYRGITRISMDQRFQQLYEYNRAILSDLIYFPVPKMENQSADIYYMDSWSQPRTYGGDRKHEGCDLMATNNKRGFFPVVSMTDGIVEKIGWLDQGGYRIGIRSPHKGYFYYAHLDSYAPEIKEGDTVIAGQLLGFMGDSGYGKEGTKGQFDVHLHLGIYVNENEQEMSVNPYYILRLMEKKRTSWKNGDTNGDLLR